VKTSKKKINIKNSVMMSQQTRTKPKLNLKEQN